MRFCAPLPRTRRRRRRGACSTARWWTQSPRARSLELPSCPAASASSPTRWRVCPSCSAGVLRGSRACSPTTWVRGVPQGGSTGSPITRAPVPCGAPTHRPRQDRPDNCVLGSRRCGPRGPPGDAPRARCLCGILCVDWRRRQQHRFRCWCGCLLCKRGHRGDPCCVGRHAAAFQGPLPSRVPPRDRGPLAPRDLCVGRWTLPRRPARQRGFCGGH